MEDIKSLDKYAKSQSDTKTQTLLGAVLTILLPIIVVAYGAYDYITLAKSPAVVATTTQEATGQIFWTNITCNAPQGCYMSIGYGNNPTCNTAAKKVADAYVSKCVLIPNGANVPIPICYTSDPVEGPTIIWKRQQSCSGRNDCRAAASLTTNNFNVNAKTWSQPSIPLFNGIHILQIFNTTEYISDLARATTNKDGFISRTISATVYASEESTIDVTNACCQTTIPGNFSTSTLGAQCYNQGDPGTVNDNKVGNTYVPGLFYQVKLRTFPTYQVTTVTNYDVLQAAIEAAGSINSIVGYCSLALVYFYRYAILGVITGRRSKTADVENQKY